MGIPREAIDLEDWKRMDKGLPPRKKAKIVIPEPKFPVVPNRIEFLKIPLEKVVRIAAIRRRVIRNEEGVSFLGHNVSIEVRDGKPLQGWIEEGDLVRLLPHVRDLTDEAILDNIGR